MATAPPPVTLTALTAERLHELLAWSEEFWRTASPTAYAELRRYLDDHRAPADPAWLVDSLGFHATHLRRLLDHTTDGGWR